MTIENSDIREGAFAILSVFLSDPMFQGQTKEKLNNPELTATVEGLVRPALETWLNNNATIADAVVGRIVLAARARQASREAASEVRRKSPTAKRTNLPGKLLDCRATDPDAQIEKAKEKFNTQTPNEQQIKKATDELAQVATTPFMKAAFRRRILEIRAQNEQTIDRHTIDSVLYSGFDAAALDRAQTTVKDFRQWIADHKDELAALQVLYAGTKPLKISLKDLRLLKDKLSIPPVTASPTQIWRAFQAVEADAVKALGGSQLADLVSLVRHAIQPTMTLEPYADVVRARYEQWLAEKSAAFTPEQREWLDRMAEHIATSLEITPDDFEDGWFGQHGSLGRAHALFGAELPNLLAELNERLAA